MPFSRTTLLSWRLLPRLTVLMLLAAAAWVTLPPAATWFGTALQAGDFPDPFVGDVFPLARCALIDAPIEEDAKSLTYEGREIRVCCGNCVREFQSNPFFFAQQIDEQIVRQQRDYYPLTTCIVDGKPLGANPVDFPFRNRLFRLCSDGCKEAVKKAPAKFFGQLDQAVLEKQRPSYPLKTCLVSGAELDATAVEFVIANRLVRLAKADLLERFNRTPGLFLEQLPAVKK